MKSLSRQTLIIIGLVVVVAAAAVYFLFLRQGGSLNSVDMEELLVPGPLGEMALGDPNAPVTVVEYASMTCSHCAAFHQTVYEPFKEKYIDTGKVRFILREYPLDPLAKAAIIVARCGGVMRFFPTVDLLFEQQRGWATAANQVEAMYSLVRQTGISRQQFDTCLADQKMLDGVNWVHSRAATEFGVQSTPTFFVDGERHPGAMTLDEISALIDPKL